MMNKIIVNKITNSAQEVFLGMVSPQQRTLDVLRVIAVLEVCWGTTPGAPPPRDEVLAILHSLTLFISDPKRDQPYTYFTNRKGC